MIPDRIKVCPHCFKGEGKGLTKQNGRAGIGREVDIFAEWNKEGVLHNIYIFGDDDFDMPSSETNITEVGFSDDQRHVSDIVCPRCLEHVSVSIPIVNAKKREWSVNGQNAEKQQ